MISIRLYYDGGEQTLIPYDKYEMRAFDIVANRIGKNKKTAISYDDIFPTFTYDVDRLISEGEFLVLSSLMLLFNAMLNAKYVKIMTGDKK